MDKLEIKPPKGYRFAVSSRGYPIIRVPRKGEHYLRLVGHTFEAFQVEDYSKDTERYILMPEVQPVRGKVYAFVGIAKTNYGQVYHGAFLGFEGDELYVCNGSSFTKGMWDVRELTEEELVGDPVPDRPVSPVDVEGDD